MVESGKTAPIPVRVDVKDTAGIIATVAEAVRSSANEEWRKTEHRETSGSVGVGGTGIGGLRGYSVTPETTGFSALIRLLPPENGHGPLS